MEATHDRSIAWTGPGCAFLLLIIAHFMCSGGVRAQWDEQTREALLAQLDSSRQDLHQAFVLQGLAGSWFVSAKGTPYLERLGRLLDVLEQDPDPEVRAQAYTLRLSYRYMLGYKLKFKRRFPEALRTFLAVADTFRVRRDTSGLVNALDAIGTLYRALGEPEVAHRQYAEALRLKMICTTMPVNSSEASIRIQMAQCLTDQGRIPAAMAMLGNVDTVAAEDHTNYLLEKARIAVKENDLDRALRHVQRADTVVQAWHNRWNRISTLAALARIHRKRHEHGPTLHAAVACVGLARELGDEAAECGCLVLSGEARVETGDAAGAEKDLLQAIDIARTYGYVGLARETGDEGSIVFATAVLRAMYRRQGRWTEAMEMTDLWVHLRDSIERQSGRELLVRDALQRQLMTDSMRHAYELAHLDELQQEELREERTRTQLAVAGGVVGMLVLALVLVMIGQRRRREGQIAQLELQRLEQERVIAEYRIRDQLGRDLHDDLGVGLGALRLKSELAQLRADKPEQKAALSDLSELSNELLVNMRQIIWAMDDSQGSLADTVAHCLDHARRYLAEHGLAIEVDVPSQWPAVQIPAIVRRNLFLIVKEALHNVVKHAGADRVRIAFSVQGERLLLTIADNGRGIASDAANKGGHGLSNMRKRAMAVQGELHIDADQGCRIRCGIPLAGAPPSA